MALLQNFSVSRGEDAALTVLIESDMTLDTIAGGTVEWAVYDMTFGVPLPSPVLIAKTTVDGSIVILDSPPMTFVISLAHADTSGLDLGVYYHEAKLIDAAGNRTPAVMYGAMAVTLALE